MFKSTSHHIYDTKVFEIWYSTYHRLNRGPCFFIFLLTQVFNLLSCVYIKNSIIFKLDFGWTTFFGLLDHAYTQNVYLTCLKYNRNTKIYKYTPNIFETP
jgi:hypothetical protein